MVDHSSEEPPTRTRQDEPGVRVRGQRVRVVLFLFFIDEVDQLVDRVLPRAADQEDAPVFPLGRYLSEPQLETQTLAMVLRPVGEVVFEEYVIGTNQRLGLRRLDDRGTKSDELGVAVTATTETITKSSPHSGHHTCHLHRSR